MDLEYVKQKFAILESVIQELKDELYGVSKPKVETPLPTSPTTTGIQTVKNMFPEDLESLLSFEEKGDYIIIKPRQFLGSDNFAKIASVVRQAGGEYVSAGKNSHFRVPKK